MKERPILFSAPMIRALLAGTKTVTRRIVKMPDDAGEVVIDPGGTIFGPGPYLKVYKDPCEPGDATMHPRIYCPYGYPGDRLWVRETHAQFAVGNRSGTAPQCVAYRATCDEDGSFDYVNNGDEIMNLTVTKWTPSIFMPRWASRLNLEVTAVHVERLHDISEEQARAEGVTFGETRPARVNGELGQVAFFNARDAFAYLWAAINGADSWKANPWVWVVEFKRVERAAEPIADLIARSSIGSALADIKERGIDAHLDDLEAEMKPKRRRKR